MRHAGDLGHAGDDVAHGAAVAQFFGERFRGVRGQAAGQRCAGRRAAGVGQHAHDFLPGKAHLGVVAGQDFLAENLRRAPVDLGEQNGGLAAGDAVGEVGDVEDQPGGEVVRAVVQELLRDAREEVAEFEQDFMPGFGRGRRDGGGQRFGRFFRRGFERWTGARAHRGGAQRLRLGHRFQLHLGCRRRGRGVRFFGRAAVLGRAFETIEK